MSSPITREYVFRTCREKKKRWIRYFVSSKRNVYIVQTKQFYSDWNTSKWFQIAQCHFSRKTVPERFPHFRLREFALFANIHRPTFPGWKHRRRAIYFRTYPSWTTVNVRLRTGRQTHVCTWNVTRHNYCGSPKCGRETRTLYKSGERTIAGEIFFWLSNSFNNFKYNKIK